VAGGFIRKLWNRSPALPPEVEEALAELRKLTDERPCLASPAAVLIEVLPMLFQEPVPVPVPAIGSDRATAKLASGIPLLRGEAVPLDSQTVARRWQDVCAALHLLPNELPLDDLIRDVLAGRPEAVHARADALGLDAGRVAVVLRLTLFPILSQLNITFMQERVGLRWERGYCPLCGSWPLLGEFRGLEQTRFLRCGWCAAEWACPRLFCPFCGTRNHHALGYFHVEGEEARYRAVTCASCRGYVKMLATLAALSPPRLLVADAATLHLDLAAAERGFVVPTSLR
jgi:FdhE protein